MQNSPSVISTQPPLPLPPPPPRFAGEVIVLPGPPPPIKPFAEAPNSVYQITVLPSPPSTFPPFDGGRSSSVDLSPLEFLLALVAIVTIPALIYTFIFAFGCSSSRRRERSVGENSGELSVASELSRRDVESVPTGEVADVKYKKEAHSMEIGGECPVCLSVFADGEEVRQLSVCKHSFHTTCIDLWLSNHSNCPICRATIAATATTAAVKSSGSNRDGDLQHRDASSLV